MAKRGIASIVPEVAAAGLEAVILDLERRIVVLSEGHLSADGGLPWAATQLRVTTEVLCPDSGNTDSVGDQLAAFIRSLHEVLSVESGQLLTDINRVIVATTPTIRCQLLLPVGPRRFSAVRDSIWRAPYVVLVLAALASVAARAGMRSFTYQSCTRLFAAYRELLEFLAWLREPVAVWPGREPQLWWEDTDTEGYYFAIIRDLFYHRQRQRRTALDEVLKPNLPVEFDKRIRFLKMLARRLAGRLMSFDTLSQRLAQGQLSLRDKVRTYALGALPLSVLRRIGSAHKDSDHDRTPSIQEH
jgi:hypothetical protein